jgi:hypothetical protein
VDFSVDLNHPASTTHPLTEMSISNLAGGNGRPVRKAESQPISLLAVCFTLAPPLKPITEAPSSSSDMQKSRG